MQTTSTPPGSVATRLPRSPYVVRGGRLQFNYHAGQRRAMASLARFILLLAGTQSGKTVFGPWWMLREIQRCGPGDYIVATPTFPLLELKCLPEYRRLFEERLQLAQYVGSPSRKMTLTPRGEEVLFGSEQQEGTRILFGHAQDPDSLESATAKAAHLDEAGQKKFKYGSWEAIQRRLAIYQGRVLITTTPYYLGWLKEELHDAADEDPDIDLIQFDSTLNPAFPEEEFERQRRRMPAWKFNMMFRGLFERPAGMIYDVWDRDVHCTPRFTVPADWPRYLGLDFGGVNTAGIFLAREPGTQRYVLYREYHEGGKTAKEHVGDLTRPEPRRPQKAAGGAKSEGQWRREFANAGLPVEEPPVSDVEVGINRVYAMLKATAEERLDEPHLQVMEDCKAVIDEIESYQRVLDEQDEPTEEIENKSEYHRLDALRYIASCLVNPTRLPSAPTSRTGRRSGLY